MYSYFVTQVTILKLFISILFRTPSQLGIRSINAQIVSLLLYFYFLSFVLSVKNLSLDVVVFLDLQCIEIIFNNLEFIVSLITQPLMKPKSTSLVKVIRRQQQLTCQQRYQIHIQLLTKQLTNETNLHHSLYQPQQWKRLVQKPVQTK